MSTASATSSSAARRGPSIRLRIALALGALSLLVILAQSLAMLAVFDETEEAFIDQILTQQIAHSMAVWKTAPGSAFPNTPAMQLYRIDGATAPSAGLPAQVLALPVDNHEIHLGGREAHVAVRQDGGARYILVYDAEEHEERLRSLTLLTLSAGALLTLIVRLASASRTAHRWPSPGWSARSWQSPGRSTATASASTKRSTRNGNLPRTSPTNCARP